MYDCNYASVTIIAKFRKFLKLSVNLLIHGRDREIKTEEAKRVDGEDG